MSLCVFGWILLALLTRETIAQCTVGPAPGSHPVRGLLERYEAGPGCSARESGPKETHVIAVGRASHSTENKVTVLLTPLASGPLRIIQLLLSSKQPVTWCLEGDALPPSVTVMVQMWSHSSVRAGSVGVQLQKMPSLPFRPRALHRWALRRHGNITSMIHSAHCNHVYIKLGQDLNQSLSCHLESAFLSNNYMISDVQPQEVQSCSLTPAPPHTPEVHIIKLHSAGSGLCGSLQVEVVVSLIPSVQSRSHNIVLILSSSVPVNWAIVAKGIQGRVDIYSSNSVSAPSPPELNLSVSSRVHTELASVSDLLLWAQDKGFPSVTSYTEADLANRFRVHLTRPGTEGAAQGRWPPWVEEQRLRQWFSGSDAGAGDSFTVTCKDGQLSVAVDQSILQRFSVPYAAVTFRDLTCQAQSNGSHFLLVFPVISCQTEGDLLGHSGRVEYTNTVFFWKEKPTTLDFNETDLRSKGPLSIHFTCLAPSPILTSNGDVEESLPTSEEQMEWPSPRHRPGPVLAMRLFKSETFEETRIGPCVIDAEHRVYAEISAKGASADLVEVKSCIISPLSDPKKSPFWSVIWDSCSSDDSLDLHPIIKLDNNSTEVKHKNKDNVRSQRDVEWTEKSGPAAEEQRLRFSFIMRAQYNEPMQFLHCSLLLCSSHVTTGAFRAETLGCAAGTPIPPLGSTATTHQCEIRNLSRPMVVTISSLVSKQMAPPAGQRSKRLCVSPTTTPGAEDISSMMQVGPLLAIVFTAFVMGTCLMGGLWCIYSHTGLAAIRERLTDDALRSHSLLNPSSHSIQSSTSV